MQLYYSKELCTFYSTRAYSVLVCSIQVITLITETSSQFSPSIQSVISHSLCPRLDFDPYDHVTMTSSE